VGFAKILFLTHQPRATSGGLTKTAKPILTSPTLRPFYQPPEKKETLTNEAKPDKERI
jgi:hypothetical protein